LEATDHYKTIQPCLFSKPFEFEGFKIGIINCFQKSQKFNGILVSHPILNDSVRMFGVFMSCYISQGDEILVA